MKPPVIRCAVPFAIALTLAGCRDGPASPSREGPLRLSASSTRAVVTAADPATLTFRLENTGSAAIRLTFSSSCQLMPYIAEIGTGEIVYPGGGGWVCLTVMTELTLPPGGAETKTVQVRAAGTSGSGLAAVLSPGVYRAYAQLEDLDYRLRSRSILIQVR